jgi:peptidoglycan/LPS O-acetylase OafA/YrhL
MNALTRQDSQQLRGLAILLIIIHNFCHVLPNAIAENEYLWSIEPILQYGRYILHGGPHLFLNLFSHYGFYGIALFIFLSGYGLATKYDQQERISPVLFLVHHATKLWRLLFVGIFIYYIAIRLFGGAQPPLEDIILLARFVSNFLPNRPLIFGPWWWFSLIMQFYVVYYLFYYNRNLRIVGIFTLICLLLQLAVTFYCRHDLSNEHGLLVYLHYNFPALVLPFSLGVYAARRQPAWLDSPLLFIASVLIVILGSFNVWIWCFGSMFACIALIQLWRLLSRISWTSPVLSWVGRLSAWAFVIHPIVRRYVFRLNDSHSVYFTLSLYLTITLALSFVLYEIMAYLDRKPQHLQNTK